MEQNLVPVYSTSTFIIIITYYMYYGYCVRAHSYSCQIILLSTSRIITLLHNNKYISNVFYECSFLYTMYTRTHAAAVRWWERNLASIARAHTHTHTHLVCDRLFKCGDKVEKQHTHALEYYFRIYAISSVDESQHIRNKKEKKRCEKKEQKVSRIFVNCMNLHLLFNFW